MSEILPGMIYSNRRFFDGCVELDKGIITQLSEERIEESSRLILPLIPNCHTHVGDYCLRGRIDPSMGLDELVRPPDGLKHRLLSAIGDEEAITGMSAALREMIENGTSVFIDFREDGMKGVNLLNRALGDIGRSSAMIFARPRNLEYDEAEIDQLLKHSEGIGLSALSDWKYDDMLRISQHTKSCGKMFSLHASEARREDISKILDLEPDFLVHMAMATEDDLMRCTDANVPIVVCPRSNSAFKIPLDISRMIDVGVTVCLGTDNAMLNSLSMIEEMRAAYSLAYSSRTLQVEEVFQLAMENPRKIISSKSFIDISQGEPGNLLIVEAEKGLTPETLVGTNMPYSLRVITQQ